MNLTMLTAAVKGRAVEIDSLLHEIDRLFLQLGQYMPLLWHRQACREDILTENEEVPRPDQLQHADMLPHRSHELRNSSKQVIEHACQQFAHRSFCCTGVILPEAQV